MRHKPLYFFFNVCFFFFLHYIPVCTYLFMCMWPLWTCVSSCVLYFLTPTALEVFFLSCTPSGEAGTSPLEVLSSSRRAPSHSSLWSLSTLRAWPRFVYDTAGGTDGPTKRDNHRRSFLHTFHQTYSHSSNIRGFYTKKTVTDSVFVTMASSKASQSHDLNTIQSIKYNTLQLCLISCTAVEAKVSRYKAKLFPPHALRCCS